jgi:hypothetical protein
MGKTTENFKINIGGIDFLVNTLDYERRYI